MVALAERLNRLWGRSLDLDVRFKPCQPLERFGVEVMVGLPPAIAWQEIFIDDTKALAVMDMELLLGAIDRQLGGKGVPEELPKRPPTMLEEAIGRKLIEKILPGITDVWRGFILELQDVTTEVHDGQFRSPWEPTQKVIETTFLGGWVGCEGAIRFLWPKELIEKALGGMDVKKVDVDDWRPQPWEVTETVRSPQIHFGQVSKYTSSSEAQMPAQEVEAPTQKKIVKEKKKIAFDDFDAMIDAINNG